jgi:hypothetical protein
MGVQRYFFLCQKEEEEVIFDLFNTHRKEEEQYQAL